MKNVVITSLVAPLTLVLAACNQAAPANPLEAASQAYAENDFRAARLHLSGLLKEEPGNTEARLLYARTLLALNDPRGAETALVSLAGSNAKPVDIEPLLAHAKLLSGEAEAALELASKHENALTVWIRISSLTLLGREDEAFAAGEKAVEAYPDDSRLLATMGSMALAQRQVSRAQAYSAAALDAEAGNLDALMLAGQLSLLRENLPAAQKYFETAFEKHPGAMGPAFSLAATEADLGNLDRAAELIAKIREYSPDHPKGIFLDAKLAFVKGELDLAYQKTLENERQLAEFPAGQLLMGEIAHLRGNHNQAVSWLEAFLRYSPGHVHASTVLTHSQIALGEDAAARETIFPVADKASASPELLALAAKLAKQDGDDSLYAPRLSQASSADLSVGLAKADEAMSRRDWDAAAAGYSELREAGWDNNAIVMNNSAMVALERGSTAKAVEYARAAHALVPRDPEVMDTLGWALLRDKSSPAEALTLLRKAKDGLPGNVGIRWHYADALVANGRKAEAKTIIRSVRKFADDKQKQRIDSLLARL